MAKLVCFSCDKTFDLEVPIGRRDTCPYCTADAKVCKNCRFFDKNAYHECLESQAEWVEDKDKGNFCDHFEARSEGLGKPGSLKDDPDLAKLFKI